MPGPFKPNMCLIRDPSSWASKGRIIFQNLRKMNLSPDQVRNHAFSVLTGASTWNRTQTHWTQHESPADRRVSIDCPSPGGPPRAEHAVPTPLYREIDSTTMTREKWCSSWTATAIQREWAREPFYGRERRGELLSIILCACPFTGCSHSPPPHTQISCENRKKKKSFRCSNYLVVILSQYLAARTRASLSYFLVFSLVGRTKPARIAAHFRAAPRLRDDDCCLKVFYQRERSYLDLYSIQYWYDWVGCYVFVCVCVIATVVFRFYRIRYLLRRCRNQIGKDARGEQQRCLFRQQTQMSSSLCVCVSADVCVCVCVCSLVSRPWPQPEGSPHLVTKLFYQSVRGCVSPCCPAGTAVLLSAAALLKPCLAVSCSPPPLLFINFSCRTRSVVGNLGGLFFFCE